MSTNEEIIDDKNIVKQSEDEELNALLDSALKDFDSDSKKASKQTSSDSKLDTSLASTSIQVNNDSKTKPEIESNEESFDENVNSDFAKFDEMFSPLLNSDPELKDHWNKLTKSCVEAANATSQEEFQNSLQETLKTISEKAQSVVGEEHNLSDEELAKIWSNLGNGSEDEGNGGQSFANLMPLMTNMMQNLLSKELLYPALSELAEKYPTFLNENKDQLSAEELKRYTKQMELMKQVCDEFDSEKPEDSESVKKERFQRILGVMQQMQQCGSPPTQLMGDVPDFNAGLPADIKLPEIPGFNDGQSQGQCLLM